MRMKEGHMRNGQFKPFMRRLGLFHQARCEEAAADAGYESLENYLYLESNDQLCFIKPTNYDQKKSSKFRKQIGLVENMRCDPEEDCFTCTQEQKLPLRRECTDEAEKRLWIPQISYQREGKYTRRVVPVSYGFSEK